MTGPEPPPTLESPRDTRDLDRVFSIDPALLGLAGTTAARVLDLGAGAGRHEQALGRLCARTVACDLDPAALRQGRYIAGETLDWRGAQRIEWVAGDGWRLPFAAGTFDATVCSETLEHVYDDMAMLGELRRVTRHGGRLAVSVPAYWPELFLWAIAWPVTHTPGGHLRMYERAELLGKLRQTGWAPYAVRKRHAFETVYWGLGAIERPNRLARRWKAWTDSPAVRESRRWRAVERHLDGWLGKSLVVYATAE